MSFGTWGFKSPFAHQYNSRSKAQIYRDGLYEDENGYYGFDGQVDAETFGAASAGVGRNHAPALLCDLYYGGSLNLEAHPQLRSEPRSK